MSVYGGAAALFQIEAGAVSRHPATSRTEGRDKPLEKDTGDKALYRAQ